MKKKLLTGCLAVLALSCTLGFASCELPFGNSSQKEGSEVVADFIYKVVNGSYTIMGRGSNEEGILEIPSEYNGVPVTAIAEDAFSDDRGLGMVVIPDSITTIGEGAFYGCKYMTDAYIGDGVTAIPDSAFKMCGELKTLELPASLVYVGESAFEACAKLTQLDLSTVEVIDKFAFRECSGVVNVTFGTALELIGESAFNKCDALKEVVIPDGAPTVIGKEAFTITNDPRELHKMSIERVVLGNSVKSVGYSAFSSVGSIREVVLGDNITTLGAKAFYKCRRLYSVTVGANLPVCETETIYKDGETEPTIYTPFSGCDLVREVVDKSGTLQKGTSDLGGLLKDVWNVRTPEQPSKVSYDDASGLIYYLGSDNPYVSGIDGAVVIAANSDKFSGRKDVDVVIPDTYQGKPVLAIAEQAFYNETFVRSFKTGDSCQYIGYKAFQNAYSLETLYLGKGIKKIANQAFTYTNALIEVYFDCGTDVTVGTKAFLKKKAGDGSLAGSPYKKVYFTGNETAWENLKAKILAGGQNEDLFATGVKVTLNYK